MKNLMQLKVESKLGTLYLVATEQALQGLYWEKQLPLEQSSPCLERAKEQLQQYLAGQRQSFDVPLDLVGTDFQKTVWRELLKIPYGTTCSYKDIARRIGRPRAIRAVGTANRRNPLCLIVPCHRVVSTDGTLGGYSGGLQRKAELLELEKIARTSAQEPIL